jgi:hypothetical protein
MTPAQLQALRAAVVADQTANAFYVNGDLSGLADYLNAPTEPAFIVWRTEVSQDEIMQNGFDWVRVDNLSAGKARIWEWLFRNSTQSINPSKSNVRAGIAECWKGTAADLAVQAAVFVHCKRSASRYERVFASGTGTDAAPATMGLVGPVSYVELVGM